MINSSSIFPDASIARVSGYTYVIVHQEARALETAILQAVQSGLYQVYVVNTFMTNTTLNNWVTVVSVNTSTGIFNVPSHGMNTGQEIQFSSSGTLPSPLTAAATYYVITVDNNNFKIATSFTNALNNIPLTILTTGSGTLQVRATTVSVQYFETWQGTRLDKGQTLQMQNVMRYFQDLGYNIYRQINPQTSTTFTWVVSW